MIFTFINTLITVVLREALDLGNTMSNFFNMLITTARRESEFSRFCQEILVEADAQKDISNVSFVNILLKNRDHLSSEEIQDEVSTMILAVSYVTVEN